MRLASLSSGSSGNSVYIGDDNTHILIDVGVSLSTIEKGLNSLGLTTSDIDAVLITHEHSDHIKGLGVLERKYDIPVYATMGTIDSIYSNSSLGVFNLDCLKSIRDYSTFSVKSIKITPHEISHDAAEPVCYSFISGSSSGAVITDLGTYSDSFADSFNNLNCIYAEANHDIRMLEMGPYTYTLKKRILSDKGHLSNEAGGRLISKLLNDHTNSVMLGHLSDKNNLPDLAYEAVRLEITMSDTKYDGNDFPIKIASRNSISEILNF